MEKKSIVDQILKLTRAQKIFFVENFNEIKSILSKKSDMINIIKKSSSDDDDLNNVIFNIVYSGLKNNPEYLAAIRSYIGGNKENRVEIPEIVNSSFYTGLQGSDLDSENQEFYTNWFSMVSSDIDSFLKEMAMTIKDIAVPNAGEVGVPDSGQGNIAQEQPQANDEVVSNQFSKLFGVDPNNVQIAKGRHGTQYAVYKGVLNIPVDKAGNVLIEDNDVPFFKDIIDNYMSFFEPHKVLQTDPSLPIAPDSDIEYTDKDEDLKSRVKKLKSSSDPLTVKYKEFFEAKSKHFNESVRTDLITRDFEKRIVDVYNQITGSKEISYASILRSHRTGETEVKFNELNKATSLVRKRVFGEKMNEGEIELLGDLANRSPEDEILFKKTMSLRAADDFANDYIGKMQKLYIGEKIGQDTHDRVMELGELVYGSSLAFDGPIFSDNSETNSVSLTEIVRGFDVSKLNMPRSMRSRYVSADRVYLPNDQMPPEATSAYQSDILKKIDEIKSSFAENGITDEQTMMNYLETLYSLDSYSYYKHTSEVTRHYQIQTELARLSSLGNKTTNSYWCSKCGRFRPQPRPDSSYYIEYDSGDGKMRKTYNIAPTKGKGADFKGFRQDQMIKSGLIPGRIESQKGPVFYGDSPVTEYERTLLSPETQKVLENKCEFLTFGECDIENNFYPNLIKPQAAGKVDSLSYWGFLPLKLFGRDVEKISLSELGANSNKDNITADRRAYFPSNYENIIDNLYKRLYASMGSNDPDVSEMIQRDLMNTVKLMASISEIQAMSSIMETPEHPVNEYIESSRDVLDYISHMIKSSPRYDEIRSLVAQLQGQKSGSWVDEESIVNLEALREFVSIFGFDAYSKSSLRRIHDNADYAGIESVLRDRTGMDDSGIHSLLLNNNITEVPTFDIAMLSAPDLVKTNSSVQSFIRKMTISRFMPEIDQSEIGTMYPDADPESSAIPRDDGAILARIYELLKAKPIRIPRMDIIFSEVFHAEFLSKGKEKENKFARLPIAERYAKFLEEYDPRDYDQEEIANMDLYFYDVPLEDVNPYIMELMDEYRKLYRSRSTVQSGEFSDPYGDIDTRKNFLIMTDPKRRRKEHAKRLAMPWVSYNEDPLKNVSGRPQSLPSIYTNIAWFKKQYDVAMAENPTPESVSQKYAQAGIQGKVSNNPVLDLALLYSTNLENAKITFEREPESQGVKKEIEIELMRQSLREECRALYIDSHKGMGAADRGKGIVSFRDDAAIVLIAGTIIGKDPIQIAEGSEGPLYDEIRANPAYDMITDIITSSKEQMESNLIKLSGAETPARFIPSFHQDMTDAEKLKYREHQKRFVMDNQQHLTAVHDTLIKYLISPDQIAHSILSDLATTGAYMDASCRQLVSTLYLRSIQGPNSRSNNDQRPYENSVAYHAKNAGTGFFETPQRAYSIFANSTDKSPAFISTVLGDKKTNWVVGDVRQVIDASGHRQQTERTFTNDRSTEMNSRKRKIYDIMRGKEQKPKTSANSPWYKKSQLEKRIPIKIEDVMFFTDRDIINTMRNISYRSGGGAVVRPVLPKMFVRPFSDFNSLTAVKAFLKKTGLKAILITPETKNLVHNMGMEIK